MISSRKQQQQKIAKKTNILQNNYVTLEVPVVSICSWYRCYCGKASSEMSALEHKMLPTPNVIYS